MASQKEFQTSAKDGWSQGDPDKFFLSEVDEVLSWEGFELRLDPASPSRKRVALELQAAAIRATEAIGARAKGGPIETPPYPPPIPGG